ncbi:YfhO family protein, partial [Candidatus Binatia bacterium]|nr:YfhO family protein [Candidatus Binatia bacterium]
AADFDPATRVLLPADEPATLPGADGATGTPGTVEVVSRSAHAIRLRVHASRDAVLVSSEVAYPGWTTRIDGRDAPTLLVDTAFRGTVVPAGTHEVEMVYVAQSFRAGLGVSALALLVAVLLWWPGSAARERARAAAA